MGTALAIVTLINALAPGVAQIILLIKRTDGTLAVMPILDEADAQYKANINQITEWLKAHPV